MVYRVLSMLVYCLLVITPARAQTTMMADSVARVYFELWTQPGHPHIEFIKIDGAWYQLSVGTDGFTALPAHAGVNALVSAILSLPAGAIQYAQPEGLDLNSLDGTASTVDFSPVDFCATLTSTTGQYYAVCADRTFSGTLWLSVADSISHQVGWFPASDDSAVFAALNGL